ncbi:MAG: hypothetical protein N2517_05440 [Ignavibacteria bacterium]|nr:hypothetical protein [Ignavibacteria bacterium]
MKKVFVQITFVLLSVLLASILFADTTDFSVHVTRKAQDLYKVEGTKIYIKTRFCYEYCYYQEALLKYWGYSYDKGKLIFKGGQEYDVEEVFEGIEVSYGTVALTNYGQLVKIKLILVPTELR